MTFELRKETGKEAAGRLRRAGLVPATLYGAGLTPLNLQCLEKPLADTIKEHKGTSFLIDLTIEGHDGEHPTVLIQQIQRHPVTRAIQHLDLHKVDLEHHIHATVHVKLVGDAVGTHHGGLLEQFKHEIEVRCLPKDLIEEVVIDVSNLDVGDSITPVNLPLPPGVECVDNPHEQIVHVQAKHITKAATEEASSTPES
jgi:large subunit ribosomal protein L25